MFKEILKDAEIISIILSIKSSALSSYEKADIKPVMIKGNLLYQVALYTANKVFHENVTKECLNEKLMNLFDVYFKQIQIITKEDIFSFKKTKSGGLLKNKTQNKNVTPKSLNHNKDKQYLLKENEIIPPLVDLGVITETGSIVKAKYDKYKQINKFLEIINDTVKEEKKLNIIDFGCGKSYLTFILYYFLHDVCHKDVQITGLDLKEDVIKTCNEIRDKYHYENLNFVLGDISLYQPKEKVDMIITLHACDVATDYAINHAIKLQVKYLLSVPCCQHEVNGQMKEEKFTLLNKYGLFKERFSALLTDSLRANILEYYGYRVNVMEFIDMAHSPKNILIRAVFTGQTKERKMLKEEITKMVSYFDIKPTLYRLLIEEN